MKRLQVNRAEMLGVDAAGKRQDICVSEFFFQLIKSLPQSQSRAKARVAGHRGASARRQRPFLARG